MFAGAMVPAVMGVVVNKWVVDKLSEDRQQASMQNAMVDLARVFEDAKKEEENNQRLESAKRDKEKLKQRIAEWNSQRDIFIDRVFHDYFEKISDLNFENLKFKVVTFFGFTQPGCDPQYKITEEEFDRAAERHYLLSIINHKNLTAKQKFELIKYLFPDQENKLFIYNEYYKLGLLDLECFWPVIVEGFIQSGAKKLEKENYEKILRAAMLLSVEPGSIKDYLTEILSIYCGAAESVFGFDYYHGDSEWEARHKNNSKKEFLDVCHRFFQIADSFIQIDSIYQKIKQLIDYKKVDNIAKYGTSVFSKEDIGFIQKMAKYNILRLEIKNKRSHPDRKEDEQLIKRKKEFLGTPTLDASFFVTQGWVSTTSLGIFKKICSKNPADINKAEIECKNAIARNVARSQW